MEKLDEGIWQIGGLLNAEDCAALILQAEATGFQVARMQNMGRNNREVFLHNQAAVQEIGMRLHKRIPQSFQLTGIGQSLECYRYQEGEFVAPHRDASRRISDSAWSNLTLVIYLNDEFEGGSTTFPQQGVTVNPELGKAVLFEHSLMHEGAIVSKGLKYIVRTDTALFEHSQCLRNK